MLNHISDVFFKLLPKGEIFSRESKPLFLFVHKLSCEFERVKNFIEKVFFEIPGQLHDQLDIPDSTSLKGYLLDWEKFLGLPDSCSNHATGSSGRQRSVVSRLAETGGQSLNYLTSVARKAAGRESLSVKNANEPMVFEVVGIDILKVHQLSCRSPSRGYIREFTREESVVCAVERVKHAHIDSRYFDLERTKYAQN